MPTYEYACKQCGEHLEVVQSFSDDALTTCPDCQGELRKVFSAAGIIFKGSGWHIKDYKSSGTGGADPGPATSTNGSSDGDGGSTSSKDTKKTKDAAKPAASTSSSSTPSSGSSTGDA